MNDNDAIRAEISQAWRGCRWCWHVYRGERTLGAGVEDTADAAMQAVKALMRRMEVDV